MGKNRLEAFSDGVLAIIITVMVLGLPTPHGSSFNALEPLLPSLLTYVLSFIYVGIYWNNHHHLLQATTHVNGRVLWANLHLLFWLSLLPVTTGWMGQNHFTGLPSATYGFILLMAAVAYAILQKTIMSADGSGSLLKQALGSDWKGKASPVLYAIGIAASFWFPIVALLVYVGVATMWIIPDMRIEKTLQHPH